MGKGIKASKAAARAAGKYTVQGPIEAEAEAGPGAGVEADVWASLSEV